MANTSRLKSVGIRWKDENFVLLRYLIQFLFVRGIYML